MAMYFEFRDQVYLSSTKAFYFSTWHFLPSNTSSLQKEPSSSWRSQAPLKFWMDWNTKIKSVEKGRMNLRIKNSIKIPAQGG